MKIEVTEIEKKVFQPVSLTLTFESEDELAYYWALFSTSTYEVLSQMSKYNLDKYISNSFSHNAVWQKLDDACSANKLFRCDMC